MNCERARSLTSTPTPRIPQVPARRIPQTLQYQEGGIQVAGLPDQPHGVRPVTSRMADYDRIDSEHRPMTDKSIPLAATFKRSVSVDPQNAPPPAPGAPALRALGEMHLGEGSAVPAWVAFDGMFLAFEAYFLEPALDGRQRVRVCCLRYYLEDGTVDVTEPKTDNSGLTQGVLLRRHKVSSNQGVSRESFVVGGAVRLYGREYRITKCDGFTRAFLQKNGVQVAPDFEAPGALPDEGPGVLGAIGMGTRGVGGRRVFAEKDANAKPNDDGEGGESADAKAKAKAKSSDAATDLLDDVVLRFFCSYDGRANGGAVLKYTLNYFLRDNTVEVLEEQGRNTGLDPFPKMLTRSKLPAKGGFEVGPPGEGRLGAGAREILLARDIVVGGTVGVYGRSLFVHDCDESTRAYYVKTLGRTLAEMAPKPPPDSAPKAPTTVPPHNGFGSEEDSLRNCSLTSLIPKRAPFDVKNFQKNDGKTLAFEACFEGARDGSVTPPNDERRFAVTFHVVDNTVSVYEPPVRNSGVLGGKFLERTLEAVKKPGSNVPYLARDFHVGATIVLNAHRFELIATDERTEATRKAL